MLPNNVRRCFWPNLLHLPAKCINTSSPSWFSKKYLTMTQIVGNLDTRHHTTFNNPAYRSETTLADYRVSQKKGCNVSMFQKNCTRNKSRVRFEILRKSSYWWASVRGLPEDFKTYPTLIPSAFFEGVWQFETSRHFFGDTLYIWDLQCPDRCYVGSRWVWKQHWVWNYMEDIGQDTTP